MLAYEKLKQLFLWEFFVASPRKWKVNGWYVRLTERQREREREMCSNPRVVRGTFTCFLFFLFIFSVVLVPRSLSLCVDLIRCAKDDREEQRNIFCALFKREATSDRRCSPKCLQSIQLIFNLSFIVYTTSMYVHIVHWHHKIHVGQYNLVISLENFGLVKSFFVTIKIQVIFRGGQNRKEN